MSGKLEGIWLKRVKGGPMDAQTQAALKANSGLVGNANQGGKRQVTIIEKEKWDEVTAAVGAPNLNPGKRRANLMVSGIDLAETRGKTLQIGNCRLRIYGETKPCEHMDDAWPGLQDALRNHDWGGGAFGEVLDDGHIAIGDPVTWVNE